METSGLLTGSVLITEQAQLLYKTTFDASCDHLLNTAAVCSEMRGVCIPTCSAAMWSPSNLLKRPRYVLFWQFSSSVVSCRGLWWVWSETCEASRSPSMPRRASWCCLTGCILTADTRSWLCRETGIEPQTWAEIIFIIHRNLSKNWP